MNLTHYIVRQKQLLLGWLKHGGKCTLKQWYPIWVQFSTPKPILHIGWIETLGENVPCIVPIHHKLADWNVGVKSVPCEYPPPQLTHIGHSGAFCHQYLWNVRGANICRRNRTLFDNYSMLSFDNISHCRPRVTTCHVSKFSPFFILLQLAFFLWSSSLGSLGPFLIFHRH